MMLFPFPEKLADIEKFLMTKYENLDITQQFALAALAFSDTEWQNFVNQITQQQRGIEQRVIVNSHTNDSSGGHDHTDHKNKGSHSNYTQRSGGHDNDNSAHANYGGGHDDSYAHYNNGYEKGHYNKTKGNHIDTPGHHWDKYREHSEHSDDTRHSNRDHDHDTYHVNTGINHTNYVPSTPAVYSPDIGVTHLGTLRVGVFSYDKNTDGYGSQDEYSKKVYYTVQIRKIKNSDGTQNVSSWKVLADKALMNNLGGYVFAISTMDPLGNGNTNPNNAAGTYELKVKAANVLSNGIVHESYEAVAEIQIRNNYSPEITVTNGNEFINFTFSYYGGVLSTFKTYEEGLFAEATENQKYGILVRISMRDQDRVGFTVKNWQKGVVRLKDTSGNVIAQADIIWSNGSTIISSDNNNVQGTAFIPREKYTSVGNKDCKIEVEVRDYLDSNCQTPAGPAVVTERTVSGGPLMTLYIDVTPPQISIGDTNYNWRNTNINTTLQVTDQGKYAQKSDNFAEAAYAITSQSTPPTTGWTTIPSGTATSRSVNINISGEGVFYVHVRAKDHAGNLKTATYGPYKIDKTAPSASASVSRSNNQFVIKVEATDNLSGVKRIKLPNGSYVNGSMATYTVNNPGWYNFVIEDNAGNKRTLSVEVENKAYVEAARVIDIVNPPQKYNFPINLPVASPIAIKTGYNITMSVLVDYADQLKLRAKVNGRTIPLQYGGSQVTEIIKNTGTLNQTWVDVTFYIKDGVVEQNQIVSIEIEAVRLGGENTVSGLGNNLFRIVGSLSSDSSVNLIR